MTSISFDRAAEYYDATRGYGEGAAEQIRDAIVAYTATGPESRFLELGVGTGRIALPFIRAGYDYTGVDISQQMMDRLEAKLAAETGASSYRYELRVADITALPFPDASFDVIVTVHVLHLVPAWQAALREARRVLRPGGWLVIGHDNARDTGEAGSPETQHAPARVREKWNALRRELGLESPGRRSNIVALDDRLLDYLRSLGARVEIVDLAESRRPAVSAREVAERLKGRLYSSDWDTPDDLHAEASRRLDEWLASEIANPDEPFTTVGRFTAITAIWG